MRPLRSVIALLVLLAAALVPSPAAAQSSGDAMCDTALAFAADNPSAARWNGYEIVGPTSSYAGSSRSQVVLGTEGDDVLYGGSGNDLLCGFEGDDTLYGGSGNDILVGGEGDDALYGESGGDTLYGTEGEVLDGGSGRNTVVLELNPTLSYVVTPGSEGNCDVTVTVTGAVPNVVIIVYVSFSESNGLLSAGREFPTNSSGVGVTTFTGDVVPGASVVSVEFRYDSASSVTVLEVFDEVFCPTV